MKSITLSLLLCLFAGITYAQSGAPRGGYFSSETNPYRSSDYDYYDVPTRQSVYRESTPERERPNIHRKIKYNFNIKEYRWADSKYDFNVIETIGEGFVSIDEDCSGHVLIDRNGTSKVFAFSSEDLLDIVIEDEYIRFIYKYGSGNLAIQIDKDRRTSVLYAYGNKYRIWKGKIIRLE